MSGFVAVDLSRLPAPAVVQPVDFSAIVAARKADIVARVRALDSALADALEATLAIEGELITKMQETGAFRETLHYARVNDAARAIMLAFAGGTDLDHKGADFEVARMVVTPANGDSPAVMEDDERYRRRIQLAPEAFSTAGAREAFIFHALSYSTAVADAWAFKPEAGRVDVIIAGPNGAAVSDEVLQGVAAALDPDTVLPLTDTVVVRRATRVDYAVSVVARVLRGPDPSIVKAEIEAAVSKYAASRYRIAAEVYNPGIIAAAKVASVETVICPLADITCADDQIPFMTSLSVALEYV